jgi:hypothetical protein
MTIVRTEYRRKRPPKRKTPVAIPMRIVTATKPKPAPAASAIGEAATERKPPAQAAAITGTRIVAARKPRPKHGIGPEQIAAALDAAPADQPPATRKSAIVTAPSKHSTLFGPVRDLDAEEHRRRGDAAVELFRELVRRAAGEGGGD